MEVIVSVQDEVSAIQRCPIIEGKYGMKHLVHSAKGLSSRRRRREGMQRI